MRRKHRFADKCIYETADRSEDLEKLKNECQYSFLKNWKSQITDAWRQARI